MHICLTTSINKSLAREQMFGLTYSPVWATTLKPYIDAINGVTCEIFDTRIRKEKELPKADYYFISGINQDYEALISFNNRIRDRFPNAKTIIGGPITYSFKVADKLDKLSNFDKIYVGHGENNIENFIMTSLKDDTIKVYEAKIPFNLSQAIPMDFEYLEKFKHDYYGGVIEVSRGCPFLCEFCDIRTLPDNNRANNKSIELVIQEIRRYCEIGISNILFACDNFIGNSKWAKELAEAIITFKEETGFTPSFYTWLTINVGFDKLLLQKLRQAGFEMFFIGIESFGTNQLLETAKVQNANVDLIETIKNIQSYGIIIVAGIIFGFDTDPEDTVDVTLNGMTKSGLLSGDPSLLTALPGTPLYKRMKMTGRLREGKLALGGRKYHTNIKYIKKSETIIKDFMKFVEIFNSKDFQLARLQNFLEILESENYVPSSSKGYVQVSLKGFLSLINTQILKNLLHRLSLFIHPKRFFALLKGYLLVRKHPRGKMSYWNFWFLNWSNSLIKYKNLSAKDFNIDSINRTARLSDILRDEYLEELSEPIPLSKIKTQRKITYKNLKRAFNEQRS